MSQGERWASALAVILARGFLRLYPRSFRGELGANLRRDFHERAVSRWRSGGPAGFTRWWFRSAASLLVNAAGAWLDVLRPSPRLAPARTEAARHRQSCMSRRVGSLEAMTVSASARQLLWGSMTDFRDAFRALRATPLPTTVAILSLALCMGANTAMFSIVDSLVLRTLPVRHADRLALLTGDDDWYSTWWTNPIWEAIRGRAGLFDGAFAYGETRFDLASGGEVDLVDGLRASGGMFDVLGVNAALGRTFTEADDRRGGGPEGAVAVISHGFWQRRFGGARDVVGRTITLDRVPFTVIGVTPPSFFGPDVGRTFDVAVPLGALALMGGDGLLESRSSWWLHVMVRLARRQTLEQGTAAVRAVQAQIADETRPTDMRPQDAAAHLARPFDLRPGAAGTSELRRDYRRPLFAVMAIVSLTLLIACGNIANLLLARGTARRHELSVRTALGASRWRLARQLLTESLVLSAIGATLGVGLAVWSSRLIVSQLATEATRVFLDVGMDWRMLSFTGAVAVGTALLFGMAPALRAGRVAPIEAMTDHGRGTSSGRRGSLSGSLVVAQVALSFALLVAAGLFVRTFTTQANRDLGFERDHALLVTIETQRTGLDGDERSALYERIRQAARALPGVSEAAISVTTPLGDNTMLQLMEFPGRTGLAESERTVHRNFVGPGWFASMGTPLTAGRDFDDRDRAGAQRTVIVNQAFAKKYFGGQNPIGRTITESPEPGADLAPLHIVGVVGNAVYRSLREPAPPTMYWPVAQMPWQPTKVTLVARSAARPPERLAPAVGEVVSAQNPDLSFTIRPFADQVNASLTHERLLATLSGFFGMLAVLLAGFGLYGIMSYTVNQRHIELGIRLALGHSPAGVIRLVLGRVAVLVGGGLLIGAAVSWWGSGFTRSLIYGVAPGDPVTIIGAIVLLVAVGTFAGWLPARRAARIDPAAVLRA